MRNIPDEKESNVNIEINTHANHYTKEKVTKYSKALKTTAVIQPASKTSLIQRNQDKIRHCKYAGVLKPEPIIKLPNRMRDLTNLPVMMSSSGMMKL